MFSEPLFLVKELKGIPDCSCVVLFQVIKMRLSWKLGVQGLQKQRLLGELCVYNVKLDQMDLLWIINAFYTFHSGERYCTLVKVVVGIQSSIVFCVNLRTERQALKHEVKGGDKVAVKRIHWRNSKYVTLKNNFENH